MYTHTKHQIDMNSDFRYTQRLIYVGKSLFFVGGRNAFSNSCCNMNWKAVHRVHTLLQFQNCCLCA